MDTFKIVASRIELTIVTLICVMSLPMQAEEPTPAVPSPEVRMSGVVVVRASGVPAEEMTRESRPRTTLILEIDADASGEAIKCEIKKITGVFDDPAATPLARIKPAAGSSASAPDLIRKSADGRTLKIEIDLDAPPSGARAINGLSAELAISSGSTQSYVEIKDLRGQQGQPLTAPGASEPWYQCEGFGPKQLTLRRLIEAAPPADKLVFTNLRGERLTVAPQGISTIKDPVEGGWISSILFTDHVPMEVHLIIPSDAPAPLAVATVSVATLGLP